MTSIIPNDRVEDRGLQALSGDKLNPLQYRTWNYGRPMYIIMWCLLQFDWPCKYMPNVW